MMDIFLSEIPERKSVKISDYGLTIMRLSYSYDIDTPNKEKIFNKILSENSIQNINGELFIEVKPEYIYVGLMQFAQAVSKITNMRLYKREVIHSMFFEMLEEYRKAAEWYKKIIDRYSSSKDDNERGALSFAKEHLEWIEDNYL